MCERFFYARGATTLNVLCVAMDKTSGKEVAILCASGDAKRVNGISRSFFVLKKR